MFSFAIKHMSNETPGKILASRVMGNSSGTIKPVRKQYDIAIAYQIDECNGSSPTTVNANFPSGKYSALNYTPTFGNNRFIGWNTKPNSSSYISNGLIAMWDGIENAGYGIHDSNATMWKDLIGNASLTSKIGTPIIQSNSVEFDGTNCFYATNLSLHDIRTVEVCVKPSEQILGKNDPEIIGQGGSNAYKIYITKQNPRLCVGITGVYEISLENLIANKYTTVSYLMYPSPAKGYVDSVLKGSSSQNYQQTNLTSFFVGNNRSSIDRSFMGKIYSIRLYNRVLTENEIELNNSIDKLRFNTDNQEFEDRQILPSDPIVYDISTVYSNWQPPTTITFDATTNGGQMPSSWTPPNYYEGQPFGTLPTPTKSGEVFLGWFDSNSNRVTESTTITSSNVSLIARYAAVTYATTYQVTTTSSYKNTGIYSATRYSSSDPIIVDWGDDTIDVIDGNISQLTHTYSSVGTFTVRISDNISTFAPSYGYTSWYNTTSQNRYTLKSVTALSNKITALDAQAYYYCAALTSVVLPQSVSTIPQYCFYYCSSLTGITLPDSVTSIGNYAFAYSGLRSSSFELPWALESIGSYAFYYITNSYFTTLTIPSLVTNIGQYAFYYCYYLHPVFEYNGIDTLTLGTYAFAYTMYNGSAVTLDLSQRKITSIPASCFYYCRYLKEIIWPYGLTTINASAFRYCFYMAAAEGEIVIPEGVTTIGGTYAFANCSYLTSVTLPSTLGNLNDYTFYYCTRLATIHAHRLTAPTVSSATFGTSSTYYTGRTSYSAGTNRLYVLSGASGYTSSYWSSVLCNASCCGYTLEEMPYFRYYNDDSENNLVFDIRSYYPTTWYNTVFGTVTYNGTVEYVNAYLGQSAREATAESGTTVAGTVLLNTKAEAAKSSISDPDGPSAGSVVGSFLDTGGENLSPESKRTRVILGRAGAWLFGPFRSNQYIGSGYYAEIGVQ